MSDIESIINETISGDSTDACEFVRVIEKRQSQKIGCIEEVAFRMGFIDKAQLLVLADKYAKSGYGEYLRNLKK